MAAYNSEGKSNPSQVVEFITKPDIPGCPFKPVIRGRVLPNSFKMAWGKFSSSCPFDLLKPFTLHVVDSLASPVCKFIFLTELCLDYVTDDIPGCLYYRWLTILFSSDISMNPSYAHLTGQTHPSPVYVSVLPDFRMAFKKHVCSYEDIFKCFCALKWVSEEKTRQHPWPIML